MFKRIIKVLRDKLEEPTYKELWEEQNIMLDHQKVEIRRRDKKIMMLSKKLERLSENNE